MRARSMKDVVIQLDRFSPEAALPYTLVCRVIKSRQTQSFPQTIYFFDKRGL